MSGIEQSASSDEELNIRTKAWKLAFESPQEVFESTIQEAGLDDGEIQYLRNGRGQLHPDSIHRKFHNSRLFASRALFGMHDMEQGKEMKEISPPERQSVTYTGVKYARERAPGLRKIENLLRKRKEIG